MEKKLTFKQTLSQNLNTAFSINYTILENLNRMMPENGQMVFTSNDIFGEKSNDQILFNQKFHEFAELKNKCYKEIKKELSKLNFKEQFLNNTKYLLEFYEEITGIKLEYNKVFGNGDIKDWDLFNQIGDYSRNDSSLTNRSKTELAIIFYQFLAFYDEYRAWKATCDIVDVLDKDINQYGAKSVYFGKIDNPNIIKVNIDDFNMFSDAVYEILDPLEEKIKSEYKEDRKKVKNLSISEQKSRLSSYSQLFSALNQIDDFYDKIGERFNAANSRVQMNKPTLLQKLVFGKALKEDPNFSIDEIYVHKIEIRELAELLSVFPPLDQLREKLDNILYPDSKNVEISQENAKSNN